ncbi:MAG: hypothetical protein KDD34_03610, partial [Bdellovibrionales bacterium]|nr:hypothetical protein [Bdellovibrionales bacterium]
MTRLLVSYLIVFQMIFSPWAHAQGATVEFHNNLPFGKLLDPKAFALAGHLVWESNVELRARAQQKAWDFGASKAKGAKGIITHAGQTMV